jgi:hypothetical protein
LTHAQVERCTALHLCQKSIFSSGLACARAVGVPHTNIQCLPVSELLITNTLATVKPRAEPETETETEAEADSEHFDTFGTLQRCKSHLLPNT